jgi:hypothetical protein
MKTTLDLRDDLLAEAKARAARERTTLTRIVEEGLRSGCVGRYDPGAGSGRCRCHRGAAACCRASIRSAMHRC